MNLLHISTFLQGGAGKVIADLAVKEKNKGNSVWVVCTEQSVENYSNYPAHIDQLKDENIPVIFLESTFNRKLANIRFVSNQLVEIIKKYGIDIIHSHAGTPSLIAMISATKTGKKIPVIQTMHGWGIFKTKLQKNQDISTLNLLDKVVAVSKSSAKVLSKNGLKQGNLSTIYNGISHAQKPTPITTDSGIKKIKLLKSKGYFIGGCVGTIDERKNQRLIIEALRELPVTIPIQFFFIGEGKIIKELDILCSEYGISDKVHFLGYKPNGREYISHFNLLVCPSLSEGAPTLSMMEAFAEKVPILASNTPEHAEAIQHKFTGLLFSNNSPDSLAKFLEICIKDGIANQYTADACKLFEENFFFEKNSNKYNKLYQLLLENRDLAR